MSRRFWSALVGIAAFALLLSFGITACSSPKAAITSSYDLAGMLASNPRSVPKALEAMGFTAVQPEAIEWENEGLSYFPEQTSPTVLTFDDLSTDDLANGHAPSLAELYLGSFPFADDRMVGTITNNLMDDTGFQKPFYNKRTPDELSDSLVRRLVGRLNEDKAPAAYWSIEVYQHQTTDADSHEHSSYYLTAWTEEAARNSESAWMQEALAAEKA